MYQRVIRHGTTVSLKLNTPYKTDEVIDQINRGLVPAGYDVESATIHEVRSVKLVRRLPRHQMDRPEDFGWIDSDKNY